MVFPGLGGCIGVLLGENLASYILLCTFLHIYAYVCVCLTPITSLL